MGQNTQSSQAAQQGQQTWGQKWRSWLRRLRARILVTIFTLVLGALLSPFTDAIKAQVEISWHALFSQSAHASSIARLADHFNGSYTSPAGQGTSDGTLRLSIQSQDSQGNLTAVLVYNPVETPDDQYYCTGHITATGSITLQCEQMLSSHVPDMKQITLRLDGQLTSTGDIQAHETWTNGQGYTDSLSPD